MKRILKSKRIWLFAGPIISAVIVGTATYHIGKAVQDDVYHMEVDGKIYKYNGIVDKYNKSLEEYNDLEDQISDKKKEVKEVKEAMKNKDSLTAEVDDLHSKVIEKQDQIEGLDSMISDKQEELDKLTSGVQAKKEEPVQLNAGQYVIGNDVKVGRYQATNVGRGTNFIVYDGDDGTAVVNTILGTSNGSGDYVFFAADGDVIQTEGQVKLIPVE
ncbi:hypothetical protein N7983_18405 [Priestia megaterium]|uniref:hypothetical protein n=2 Tax=Priestia megaterium TaxID=1404 RepID=UPI0020D21D67|nr:hypothetical protein [Priestia megaterium]MCU7739759.1 hypothetical protein [Priestia megaterium]MCU7745137.1 hypothetical protein [Priestia megaterium]